MIIQTVIKVKTREWYKLDYHNIDPIICIILQLYLISVTKVNYVHIAWYLYVTCVVNQDYCIS